MATQLSRGQQWQMRRLSSQNRRAKIRLALMDAGVQAPALNVDASGMVDVLEVGKVVAQLLEALGQDVPDELSDTDPEKVAEAILSVLADASGAGSSNIDPAKIGQAMGDDPVQMRNRRGGQRTRLSTGRKLSYVELLRKPHAQMTMGDRHRLGMFKAGINPDAPNGKKS